MISELRQLVEESHHKSITDIFMEIFSRIKKDSDLYNTIASENDDSTFPARILTLCYKEMNLSLESQFPKMSKAKREWLFYFMANGCSGILGHWISTGMNEDVTEMSEFIGELSNKVLS